MDEASYKACSDCGNQKPLNNFHHHCSTRDRLYPYCKVCASSRNSAYRAANKDRLRQSDKAYRERNREALRVRRKANATPEKREKARLRKLAWREKNREKVRKQMAAWKQANASRFNEKVQTYRDGRKEKMAVYLSEYRRRPEVKRRLAERARQRRRDDPTLRLTIYMRVAIRRGVLPGAKSRRTFDLLGYTAEELRAHLEAQFRPGMNWDNYGEWHIDHIRPLASFSFDVPEHPDFRTAWALSNLQPLWAAENLSKGAKWMRGSRN